MQNITYTFILGTAITLTSCSSEETKPVPPSPAPAPTVVAPTVAAADLRLMAGVADERLEGIESGMTETRESLQHFSAAISEYGTHLQSHTATVRAMSTASESLVEAVDRQNTVLERLRQLWTGRRTLRRLKLLSDPQGPDVAWIPRRPLKRSLRARNGPLHGHLDEETHWT